MRDWNKIEAAIDKAAEVAACTAYVAVKDMFPKPEGKFPYDTQDARRLSMEFALRKALRNWLRENLPE